MNASSTSGTIRRIQWGRPSRSTTIASTTAAASSASSAIPKRPTSPTSASTPCSTAGQESAGIVSSDGEPPARREGDGPRQRHLHRRAARRLEGDRAIGHVRYSTAGDTVAANAQPILIECHRGPIALGHNGNLVNADDPAPRAGGGGLDLPVHLRHRGDPAPLRPQPPRAAGGRDRGQPLQGDGRVLAALPHPRRAGGRARPLGLPAPRARPARRRAHRLLGDLRPRPDRRGVRARRRAGRAGGRSTATACARSTPSRPSRRASASSSTSTSRGRTARSSAATSWRRACSSGRQLAREAPADADIVVPVPDSGMGAALGYSQESGLPFEWGLIRNHYVGRTFIEPKQSIRSFGVKIKLNPVRSILEGKRVVLIDDSIVRGTTSRKIVGMVRAAGAARGPHAHQQPAHHRPLLLRHRHPAEERAHRVATTRSRRSGSTSAPTAWPTCRTRGC